jgi:hypothetical protein
LIHSANFSYSSVFNKSKKYPYLLPDDELFELLLFDDDEFERLDVELSELDERLGVAVVELPDERLGVVVVELPDERLGVVVVELPDERLGVVVVELPDERLGVVVVEFPDERLGVVVVELPDERLGVADVPADGFLVPVLVDGLVVVDELLEGVEFVMLLPDCLVVVPPEFLDGVLDEILVTLSEGRVELVELLEGTDTGLA